MAKSTYKEIRAELVRVRKLFIIRSKDCIGDFRCLRKEARFYISSVHSLASNCRKLNNVESKYNCLKATTNAAVAVTKKINSYRKL